MTDRSRPVPQARLARLRDAAHIMPPAQLNRVLVAGWGPDWRRRFTRFDATPVAAASIGQVHRAVLPSGRVLAVKVQYPGVAASIDADIDNVATLLRHVTASRATGLFDFADRSFVADLRARAAPVIADRASWHIPPVETLFTQRKISGTAMLCVRMGARLPLLAMAGRHAGG